MGNFILYHGSKFIIKNPTRMGSRRTNDYGYGFYCTEQKELACEWACPDNNDGYANKYVLDATGLNILDLTKKEYNILNWIALLSQYRMPEGMTPNDMQVRDYILKNFALDLTNVDVIIGYRADDSYFSFARDFVKNSITVSQLAHAMALGKLGIQIVIHSDRAFEKLEYVSSDVAKSEVYYAKRTERDMQARNDYVETTKNLVVDSDDLFVMDIIRQEVKNDDPRLQRVVSE